MKMVFAYKLSTVFIQITHAH